MSEPPGRRPPRSPPAAKDVLAVEAQELRAVEARRARAGSRAFGYREVMTPVLEFAEVIDRAQEGGLREAFRLFDDAGRVLVLRPDLTIPVARLVATRMADHPGPGARVLPGPRLPSAAARPPAPVRAAAGGHRAGGRRRPGGRRRGAGAAGGEPARRRARRLPRGGGRRVADRRGAGRRAASRPEARAALGAALARATSSSGGGSPAPPSPTDRPAPCWWSCPACGAGPSCWSGSPASVPAAAGACERLRDTAGAAGAITAWPTRWCSTWACCRDWPYYSGIVFEAYAPGVGAPIAMGGRYDEPGRPLRPGASRRGLRASRSTCCTRRRDGGRERRRPPPRDGVVLVGGLDRRRRPPARRCAPPGCPSWRWRPTVPTPRGSPPPTAGAGWRGRSAGGYAVLDRVTGDVAGLARLEEVLPSRA